MRTQACSTGSSGRAPSARSQTCCVRRLRSLAVRRRAVDVAGVDGPRPVVPLARAARGTGAMRVGEVGQGRRVGDVGRHRLLVVEARLGAVEPGLQVEDGLAVLDGDDPPGGEAPAVADAVDLVEDRHRRVARAQEVGVQRVHQAARVVDRACRGDQRLAGHLPAEHPLAALVGRDAPEDVDLDGLEVEQGDQVVEGSRPAAASGGHRRHVDTSVARAGGSGPASRSMCHSTHASFSQTFVMRPVAAASSSVSAHCA